MGRGVDLCLGGDKSLASGEGFPLVLWGDCSGCSSLFSRWFVIDLESFKSLFISATCALMSVAKLLKAFSSLVISDGGSEGLELFGMFVESPIGL